MPSQRWGIWPRVALRCQLCWPQRLWLSASPGSLSPPRHGRLTPALVRWHSVCQEYSGTFWGETAAFRERGAGHQPGQPRPNKAWVPGAALWPPGAEPCRWQQPQSSWTGRDCSIPANCRGNVIPRETQNPASLSDIPKYPGLHPKTLHPTDLQTCTKPAPSTYLPKASESRQCQTLQIWQISSVYV